MKKLPIALILSSILSYGYSSVNVTFTNNTTTPAHIDYTNCSYLSGAKGDSVSGAGSSDNSVVYSCEDNQNLQIAKYGASGLTDQCYINVNNGVATLTKNKNCITSQNNHFAIGVINTTDFKALANNANEVIKLFVAQKEKANPSTYSDLPANVIPMNQETLDSRIKDPDAYAWAFQYGYDSGRFPLFYGALCMQNPSAVGCADVKSTIVGILDDLKKVSQDGQLPSAGLWAYTISGVGKDGDKVLPSTLSNLPALLGPTVVAEYGFNGDSDFFKQLITQLESYKLSEHTPASAGNDAFLNSTAPYFNAVLGLLSQAFLVGKGELGANNTNAASGYLSQASFNANYRAWVDPKNGFVNEYPCEDGKTCARVIFSVENAPHDASKDTWANAGDNPTVSEGMAYGLLISYAANDQKMFDSFVRYIMSESAGYGCALYYDDQCHVKSDLMMPWLVDATGKPFHYTLGGGFYTNGSATDADVIIAWALSLANKKVAAGDWSNTSFAYNGDQASYDQLFESLKKQIALYDTYNSAEFFGQKLGWLSTPGNQWSDQGHDVFYSGYNTPQAFEALGQ
ncbi:glycosyl hydrolase family 8 [Cysteiniphilum marinum]|uniref:glycosyl hydrolase family 8 n=1 Tax=Cysteiniphilum marinum TaxID=2774191 RepID=UPI001939E97B|nr:glycosyl hydrolase family 8 [Cysteiniphilum marinum]